MQRIDAKSFEADPQFGIKEGIPVLCGGLSPGSPKEDPRGELGDRIEGPDVREVLRGLQPVALLEVEGRIAPRECAARRAVLSWRERISQPRKPRRVEP